MRCFVRENQTYTGTVIFGVESLKGYENPPFLSWRTFFALKYDIQSTKEIAFKRTETLSEISLMDLIQRRVLTQHIEETRKL